MSLINFAEIKQFASTPPVESPRFIDLTAPVEYLTLTGDMIPAGVTQRLRFLFESALPDEEPGDAIENKRFGLKDCWVAGGALLAATVGAEINDYDLFCADPAALEKQIVDKKITHVKWGNERVENFRMDNDKIIQVVKAFKYQTMEQTLDDFDFTIIGAAYDGEKIICHPRWLLDIAQKRIVVHRLVRTLNTMNRLLKYTSRGYSTCPVSFATILRQVQSMNTDWENPNENEILYYSDGSMKYPGID